MSINDRTSESHKERGSLGGLRLDGEQVGAALRDCCERSALAVVTPSDMSDAYNARFLELSDSKRTVTLEVLDHPEIRLEGYFSCCVSYFHAERGWLFLSQVRDYLVLHRDEPPRLVLRIPPHVVGTDLRRSVRITVAPGEPCAVKAHISGERPAAPQLVDISLGGMSLEFPPDTDPDCRVGTIFRVSLSLGEKDVELEVEVRRRDGRRYGLSLPASGPGGPADPPEPYRRIVQALERQWFAALR